MTRFEYLKLLGIVTDEWSPEDFAEIYSEMGCEMCPIFDRCDKELYGDDYKILSSKEREERAMSSDTNCEKILVKYLTENFELR